MQKVDSYKSFSNRSLDDLLNDLYQLPNGKSVILRAICDKQFSKRLDCIEDYVLVAKRL